MNRNTLKPLLTACLFPLTSLALAQGHDMKEMKGMNMPMSTQIPAKQQTMHMAQGTVKAVSSKSGEVTIAHGPVKSLNWPAMTMTFLVQDRAMLEKLAPGKLIDFEFMRSDKGYLVTSVK
ncbi:copper-binding protein [Aquabacterium sp.]|uniref:copper-binding protein n=1 Tax=Aquabacterium sp. TaxID=1872578 RepID=UPI0035B088F3